jgi:hypothetical protein
MTGQASPPGQPHDAGQQHILREQIDGAAGLCNDPALAVRRNSSAHSRTHRRQRHPARDKPYPPYLHPPVTASVLWATALKVQEFDKGREPVGFVPIGQACDLPV